VAVSTRRTIAVTCEAPTGLPVSRFSTLAIEKVGGLLLTASGRSE
jgi:hypothetical protein